MATKQSHIIIKHHTRIIISVYSDLLQNEIGGFLYNLTLNINLIQKDKLIPEVNINHLKIYILHNATLSTIGSVKIPILCHLIKLNVIIPKIGICIAWSNWKILYFQIASAYPRISQIDEIGTSKLIFHIQFWPKIFKK